MIPTFLSWKKFSIFYDLIFYKTILDLVKFDLKIFQQFGVTLECVGLDIKFSGGQISHPWYLLLPHLRRFNTSLPLKSHSFLAPQNPSLRHVTSTQIRHFDTSHPHVKELCWSDVSKWCNCVEVTDLRASKEWPLCGNNVLMWRVCGSNKYPEKSSKFFHEFFLKHQKDKNLALAEHMVKS